MAKYKSILKSCVAVVAGKKRKCYHCVSHEICKGDIVLEIKDGMYAVSGYCKECAMEMIRKSRVDLEKLENILNGTMPVV